MKSLTVTRFGTPPSMQIEERPEPVPGTGQSLVRVHAALVNPLSDQVRSGFVSGTQTPLVLGVDGSGTIEESTRFAPGTRVAVFGAGRLGIAEDGLQQELIAVDDSQLYPLPDTLSMEEGAALLINFLTAHQAMRRVAEVEAGQVMLVSGATGAVGQALIQLARALDLVPIALVSTSEKIAAAREVDATHVIDLSSENLAERIKELTDGQGADLAFDTVGGALTGQLAASLRTRGKLITIGFIGGSVATIDLVDLVVEEKRILGYDVFLETPSDLAAAFTSVAGLVETGKLRPRIDSVFAMEEFDAAYERLTSRQAKGAVLLKITSG